MAAEQRLGALQDELQVQRTEAERLSRLNEQLVAQLAAKNEEILQLRARIGAAADHVPPAGDAPPVDDRVVLNRPATRIENIAMEYKEVRRMGSGPTDRLPPLPRTHTHMAYPPHTHTPAPRTRPPFSASSMGCRRRVMACRRT